MGKNFKQNSAEIPLIVSYFCGKISRENSKLPGKFSEGPLIQ